MATTAKSKTVKFGKIDLPKFDPVQDADHVPAPELYMDEHGVMEELAWAWREGEDTLLLGPTGVGKTSVVRAMCAQLGAAYRRVPCQEATDTAALIGKPWLWVDRGGADNGSTTDDEGTGQQEMIFQRGMVYDAVLYGHTLVLDEWNLAHPDVQLALNPLFLADEGSLIVMENEGEVVPRAEGFRLVATGNPAKYAGVKQWNPAALSRFGVVIQMQHLSGATECKIIAAQVPDLDSKIVEFMVEAAQKVREATEDQRLRFEPSLRELVAWAKMVNGGFDVKRACERTFLGKVEADERDSVETLVKMVVPPAQWK